MEHDWRKHPTLISDLNTWICTLSPFPQFILLGWYGPWALKKHSTFLGQSRRIHLALILFGLALLLGEDFYGWPRIQYSTLCPFFLWFIHSFNLLFCSVLRALEWLLRCPICGWALNHHLPSALWSVKSLCTYCRLLEKDAPLTKVTSH